MDTQTLVGGEGCDHLRTDYYQMIDSPTDVGTTDQYLFGDYGYGPTGMEYAPDMQYGSDIEHRMNELWGDDDIIHGGNGDGTKKQYMFGGDGEDELHFGYSWAATYGFGHDGNDKISIYLN